MLFLRYPKSPAVVCNRPQFTTFLLRFHYDVQSLLTGYFSCCLRKYATILSTASDRFSRLNIFVSMFPSAKTLLEVIEQHGVVNLRTLSQSRELLCPEGAYGIRYVHGVS